MAAECSHPLVAVAYCTACNPGPCATIPAANPCQSAAAQTQAISLPPNTATEHCRRTPFAMSIQLSATILTRNEAHNIGDCIASLVGLADEVIVLDSGSTDATRDIARAHGTRLIEDDGPWPGFGPQKNRALDAASGEWILSIDADERVTPELADEIRAAIAQADASGTNAYAIPRLSQFCGTWVHHCGWRPDYVTRLVRRGQARFSDNLVHESLQVTGATGRLRASLLHYSYTSMEQVQRKSAQYAEAGAREFAARGKRPGWLSPALHGGWAFIRTLLLRRGFLDGKAGWAIARMNASVSYRKYQRARELTAA